MEQWAEEVVHPLLSLSSMLMVLFSLQDLFSLTGHRPPQMPSCISRSVNPKRWRQFNPRRWVQVWTVFFVMAQVYDLLPSYIILTMCLPFGHSSAYPTSADSKDCELYAHVHSQLPLVFCWHKKRIFKKSPWWKGSWNTKRIKEKRLTASPSLPSSSPPHPVPLPYLSPCTLPLTLSTLTH